MLCNNYFIMFYFIFCKKIYQIFCVLGKVICIDYNLYFIKIFVYGFKYILKFYMNNLVFDVELFFFISRYCFIYDYYNSLEKQVSYFYGN